jgi:hypothetical protein
VVDEDGDLGRRVEGAEPGLLVHGATEVDGVEGVIKAVGVAQLLKQDEDLVTFGSVSRALLGRLAIFRSTVLSN